MARNLEIVLTPSYVHAKASGLATAADAMAVWAEINRACQDSKINKILAEIHVPGPVPVSHLFQFGEYMSTLRWPQGIAVAVVCDKALQANGQFTSKVITNRCHMAARIFEEVQDAECWLASQGSDEVRSQ
jgi:hypothetical protein